jgi:hypothetical protein
LLRVIELYIPTWLRIISGDYCWARTPAGFLNAVSG